LNSDDSSNTDHLKEYEGDMPKVYKKGNNKRNEVDDAYRQLMEYAEALKTTISEVKSKNAMLGALALELSIAEERERSKIAEDIHDHIGQMLAMSKVKLQELSKSSVNIDTAKLYEIEELIQQAISYSRSMMFEISPNALLELGFGEAVEWLIEHMHNKYQLDIQYSLSEQAGPMDSNVSIVLFKAVRELLINIVKHAHTDKAYVSVENSGDGFRIIVRDEGAGFNISKMHPAGDDKMKFGLFNLQQRIINAGGSIDINSSEGRGTRVLINLPRKSPGQSEDA